MKTLLQLTAIATLTVALIFSSNASNINFEPEPYINDIPFNTEEVAASYLYQQPVAVPFEFEDETYIDDIPFSTACVAADCLYHKALKVTYSFNDEPYVDDIPFNTEKIVLDYLFEEAQSEEFTFTEEPYIDNIPAEILEQNIKTLTIEIIHSDLNHLIANIK